MVWPSICLVTSNSMSISRFCGAALDHALHDAHHPARAFAARRALAAALMLVEGAEAPDGADDVGGLVHDDHRRRAERRARLLECRRNPSAHGCIFSPGTQGTDAPPGITASRLSQPPRMPPQCFSISLLERQCPSLLRRWRACSRGPRRMNSLVPVLLGRPMPANQAPPRRRISGTTAMDLDVVDGGRVAIDAHRCRERRLQARLALLALERSPCSAVSSPQI